MITRVSTLCALALLASTSGCGSRDQLPAGQRYAEPDSLEAFCWGAYRAEVDGEALQVAETRLAVQFMTPQRMTIHFDTAGYTAVSFAIQAPSGAEMSSNNFDLEAMPDGWLAEMVAYAPPNLTTVAAVHSDRDPMEGVALLLATSERLTLTACAWGKDSEADIPIRVYGKASLGGE